MAGWKKVSKISSDEAINDEEVRYIFNLIDDDDNGYLSMDVSKPTTCLNSIL